LALGSLARVGIISTSSVKLTMRGRSKGLEEGELCLAVPAMGASWKDEIAGKRFLTS
jgi:hypothetical protein